MNTTPEPNPYLPRVDTMRLLNLLGAGHTTPAANNNPSRRAAGNFQLPDTDRDGVPDLFDCDPIDPTADGWIGDAYKRAQAFFRVDYAVAARRRASVGRTVSGAAGRAAAVVRRAPPSPTRYVARRVSAAVSRRVAPTVTRIVSRPSSADIKRVAAAAFPQTTAMITGAAELKKAVGAVSLPSRAELVQTGITAFPTAAAGVAVWRGAVAAKPTFDAVVTRTKEMRQEPPSKVEAQARTERQKYEQMVAAYELKYPDPSKPLPEQQKYQEMADAYRVVVGDYQAIQEQRQITDTAYEKTVSAGSERYLEEHQAIAPVMSEKSLWIAQQTGRVAEVARGFEKPIEEKLLSIEERLGLHSKWIPEPVRTVGWATKELGYGIAFTGTSAAVEMAGMIPGGIEVMAKKPSIIAPAAIYGTYLMGKGAWEGVTKSPTRFAGELITFGALMKGGEIALKPVTPTIIHGEGYVGVGIKGFRKPTYKTVEVKVTPKEFLRHEQAAGRIGKISHKSFTDRPSGESPLGTARIDVGEPMATTKPTQIFISPKTYGYSALRRIVEPYQKVRGADIHQQRKLRSKYPTREEVLTHELLHHKFPEFSEGKVQRMTREFGEIPSKKIFTIPKRVKTGYVREPIPFIGVRTKSGIPPVEGVTATYRGIQIGRRWTPAEYYKAAKIDTITTPEGTLLEARSGVQVRVGKLRYEKEAVARGAMEGGYFLPEARPPAKPAFQGITTAEKGIIPLEPGKFPLSLDVVTPKTSKPTWFYGEIRRPYAKVGEARLFGSEARMRWSELGERRLIYGIKGAPKQPKIILTTEGWGYHPTYPTGIAAGKAVSPAHFRGYTPPKQIPLDMRFKTTVYPESSVFFDFGHLMRPTKPKPIETPPFKPADRGVGAVTPRVRSEGIAPIPELMPEAATGTARMPYAEPTVCIGGVCYRDAGVPTLQRVPPAKPPAKQQVSYAEPFTPDPAFSKLWDEVGKADSRALTVEGAKPLQRPIPGERWKTAWAPHKPPSFEVGDVPASYITPFAEIIPIHIGKEEDWRKTMPMHITDVEIITDTVTEPAPFPEIQPSPTPLPYLEPEPGDMPPPSPDPWGGGTPPHTPTPVPDPPLPKLMKPIVEDKPPRRKVRGKRDPFEWHIDNPIITLDEFFSNPLTPKNPVKSKNMIPTIPAGVV